MNVVAVVVPTLGDDEPKLMRLVQAVISLEAASIRELVIVDNSATGSLRLGEYLQRQDHGAIESIRIVHEPLGYSYAARNAGIVETRASFLAFLDDDVVPRPTYGRAIDRIAATGEIGVYAGPVDQVARSNPTRFLDRGAQQFDLATGLQQQKYVDAGWAATANLVVHRTVFERVGMFDQRLESSGDLLFTRHACLAGWCVRFVDDLAVEHDARDTFRSLARKQYRVGYGHGRLVAELGQRGYADLTGSSRHPFWPMGAHARWIVAQARNRGGWRDLAAGMPAVTAAAAGAVITWWGLWRARWRWAKRRANYN